MSSRRKVFGKIFIILLAIILLILIFLPMLAKNYVIDNSKELLGRQVDMDKLRINYFTSTLRVFDFKMYEADEKEVFVSFDTLVVNTEPYKLLGKTLSLEQFYLRGLRVNISKRDSVFNFDDLVAYHSTPDSVSTAEQEEEAPFKFQFEDVELNDGAVEFHDLNVDQTFGVEDLFFYIPYIEWDQENNSEADFELDFKRGGTLKSDFVYQPKTKDFEGVITLDKMPLEAYQQYVGQKADISHLDGKLDAVINLRGNSLKPDQTLVSGKFDVINLELKDLNGQRFLAAASIASTLEEIDYFKKSFRLGELIIDQPYIRFELDSVSNNISRIFHLDQGKEASSTDSTGVRSETPETAAIDSVQDDAPEPSKKSEIYYALQKFRINNGKLDYTDNLTGEPFDYHLSEISINTDSIYSDSDWLNIRADMLLNDRGNLNAVLGFEPETFKNISLDIAIKDFVLSDLNIYSTYYTGHAILKGDMFYFSDSEVTDGKIESKNTLLIKDVSVESTEGGLMSIPLKLAVFILKDENGDIELNVPVRGDLNDPEVDIWDLVGSTFKKKIFDTADNPAAGLARVVDAKPEDIEAIIFHYPDTTLTEAYKKQLDLILELEAKKKGLDIEMNYVYDKEMLMDSLSGGLGGTQVEAVKREAERDQDTTGAAITGALDQGKDIDTVLTNYGRAFLLKIEDYIREKNANSEIEVKLSEISDPDRVGALPQFKVKFTLREKENDKTDEAGEGNRSEGKDKG